MWGMLNKYRHDMKLVWSLWFGLFWHEWLKAFIEVLVERVFSVALKGLVSRVPCTWRRP